MTEKRRYSHRGAMLKHWPKQVRESIVVLDEDLRILTANQAFLETFHVKRREIENQLLDEIAGGQWNIPTLLDLLRRILPKDIRVDEF